MKLNNTAQGGLSPANVKQLHASNDKPFQNTDYHHLLYLLADMFDSIAVGQDWYIIVGATKDKSAFSLTVVHGQDRQSVYAPNLGELAAKTKAFV